MLILALDLAERRTGVAIGRAGQMPDVYVVQFRREDQRMEDAIESAGKWLMGMLDKHKIELVCAPHYISVAAFGGAKNTNDPKPSFAFAIEGQIQLHGVVRAISACYHVPFRAPSEASVRKHFCGRSLANPPRRRGQAPRTSAQRAADRKANKDMVIARAIQLGYLPKGCSDNDLGDAVALWDFSSVTYGRRNTAFALLPS